MAALSDNRDTKFRHSPEEEFLDVLATSSTEFYKGGLVSQNASGMAHPSVGSGASKVIGVAYQRLTTAAANTKLLNVRKGRACLANGDTIVAADRGKPCYVQDDQTVYKNSLGTRPFAGVIYDVTSEGVWVDVASPYHNSAAPIGATGPVGA